MKNTISFDLDDDMVVLIYAHCRPSIPKGEDPPPDPPLDVMREAVNRKIHDHLREYLFGLTHNEVRVRFKEMGRKGNFVREELDQLQRVGEKIGKGWQFMDIGFQAKEKGA